MSPRTKEQFSLIKDERREQILLAALKVFARRGYSATKITDIAAAANLSNGLVYHYFESKEKIFIELVTRAMSQAAEGTKEVYEMQLEPLEKIRTLAEHIIDNIYETEDSAYYFLLMLQAYVSDANPKEVSEVVQSAFDPGNIMLKVVEEGQKNGSIHEGNIYQYVRIYWAAIQGLALHKIIETQGSQKPDVELLMRIFKK